MKMMNQIIIEGKLNTNPEFEKEQGNDKVSFALLENDEGTFKIRAFGEMAQLFMRYGRADSRVRVVGRLCSKYGVAYILSEHMQFFD